MFTRSPSMCSASTHASQAVRWVGRGRSGGRPRVSGCHSRTEAKQVVLDVRRDVSGQLDLAAAGAVHEVDEGVDMDLEELGRTGSGRQRRATCDPADEGGRLRRERGTVEAVGPDHVPEDDVGELVEGGEVLLE